ncbi:MAG: hypothetical protein GY769_10550 [bacterium]|nr:hypothetical protein [bacterium]
MMVETADVLSMEKWLRERKEGTSSSAGHLESDAFEVRVSVEEVRSGTSEAPVPVTALYPALGESCQSVLGVASKLLDLAEARLQSALQHYRDGEHVDADDDLQHFHGTVRELFCCRSLGDGFGGLVNTLQIALTRRKGHPLEEAQIDALLGVVTKLQAEPYIPFPDVVEHAGHLASVGFLVDPPGLDAILEERDEESLR